jgi:hypothetical protein
VLRRRSDICAARGRRAIGTACLGSNIGTLGPRVRRTQRHALACSTDIATASRSISGLHGTADTHERKDKRYDLGIHSALTNQNSHKRNVRASARTDRLFRVATTFAFRGLKLSRAATRRAGVTLDSRSPSTCRCQQAMKSTLRCLFGRFVPV